MRFSLEVINNAIDIWQSSLGTMTPVTVVCSYLISNVLKSSFKCNYYFAKTLTLVGKCHSEFPWRMHYQIPHWSLK